MTQQDKDREAFEKWAFEYLRQQYSFYTDTSIRDMLLSHRSERRNLEAAWQAARNHYAPKLTEKDMVERAAMAIATEYYERDYSKDVKVSPYEDSGLFAAQNWKEFQKEAIAALRAAGMQFKEEA